ncbi:MAG: hypothetical protein MASP_01200 [Candidatus Methanolliviera sp. GoM_asphalt]|nr:MAG: hypothetical protein MASP_01200 [Candidatus Methanolliviera sp. GoM_asphalt]
MFFITSVMNLSLSLSSSSLFFISVISLRPIITPIVLPSSSFLTRVSAKTGIFSPSLERTVNEKLFTYPFLIVSSKSFFIFGRSSSTNIRFPGFPINSSLDRPVSSSKAGLLSVLIPSVSTTQRGSGIVANTPLIYTFSFSISISFSLSSSIFFSVASIIELMSSPIGL